mmetsp:Transcript_39738/g.124099  ORF Transcript_39738/g.124099 Transcript_39738/m.124099 type:complete len:238 (-) Transcript_39738:165-878(-)
MNVGDAGTVSPRGPADAERLSLGFVAVAAGAASPPARCLARRLCTDAVVALSNLLPSATRLVRAVAGADLPRVLGERRLALKEAFRFIGAEAFVGAVAFDSVVALCSTVRTRLGWDSCWRRSEAAVAFFLLTVAFFGGAAVVLAAATATFVVTGLGAGTLDGVLLILAAGVATVSRAADAPTGVAARAIFWRSARALPLFRGRVAVGGERVFATARRAPAFFALATGAAPGVCSALT